MNEISLKKKEPFSVYMFVSVCTAKRDICTRKLVLFSVLLLLFFLLLLIFKNHLYAVCVCSRSLCICPLMNNVAKERTLTSYKTQIYKCTNRRYNKYIIECVLYNSSLLTFFFCLYGIEQNTNNIHEHYKIVMASRGINYLL